MKVGGILIIAALAVSLLSPCNAGVSISAGGDAMCIVSLDVCEGRGGALSAASDSPLLLECCCRPAAFGFAGFVEISSLSPIPSLSADQAEKPPKA